MGHTCHSENPCLRADDPHCLNGANCTFRVDDDAEDATPRCHCVGAFEGERCEINVRYDSVGVPQRTLFTLENGVRCMSVHLSQAYAAIPSVVHNGHQRTPPFRWGSPTLGPVCVDPAYVTLPLAFFHTGNTSVCCSLDANGEFVAVFRQQRS